MPWKKCSNSKCDHESGPRVLYCKCGTPFEKTLKAFGHIGGKAKAVNSTTVNINFTNSNNKSAVRLDMSGITPRKVNNDLPINTNPAGFFDHIFDREPQIDVMIGAVTTAIESNFKERPHLLLTGDPSGGKTTLAIALRQMIGEEYCFNIDATSSTRAGILQELLNAPIRPNFIFVEEIEKVDFKQLRWLLAMMDDRAEISVCNKDDGFIRCHLPALVIATVNDESKLAKCEAGALASRFGNKIFCPAISEETLYKVIKKGVDAVNGKESWIKPAIRYCIDVEQTRDPRRIKAVALGGKDRLLDGSYQKILKMTSRT